MAITTNLVKLMAKQSLAAVNTVAGLAFSWASSSWSGRVAQVHDVPEQGVPPCDVEVM